MTMTEIQFNPFIVSAKKIAHGFIYSYDYMRLSKELVDKKLKEIFKCYANDYIFKTTVAVQIRAERKNIEKNGTSFAIVEKDFGEVNKELDKLLNHKKR